MIESAVFTLALKMRERERQKEGEREEGEREKGRGGERKRDRHIPVFFTVLSFDQHLWLEVLGYISTCPDRLG